MTSQPLHNVKTMLNMWPRGQFVSFSGCLGNICFKMFQVLV